ncbi:hypothetical protein [Serratia phage BUCT660]|nr:hypothetical protein [Serratia phage BUCT660]
MNAEIVVTISAAEVLITSVVILAILVGISGAIAFVKFGPK